MKRLITCILALMMLLSCAAYAISLDQLHVVGCEEFITLREEPSTSAKAIVQIPLGALVTCYEYKDNGFARVYYGGCFGFVQSKYLSEVNPETGGEWHIPMYVANCNEFISLREDASTFSDCMQRMPLGAQVECYLRTVDGPQPMENVGYPGSEGMQRGYALSRYLCFLPPETDSCALVSATLRMNGDDGVLTQQTVTDPALLKELEGMIRRATPTILTKCPMAAQLELELLNGDTLRFAYPIDGCATLIAENQSVYTLTSADGERLWQLFDVMGCLRANLMV
ncbi:MAG: SH3 domain-containing protein [Clostridia bacterium]|nr:SH3 domain-containing protein [Clostridia bacterium]